MIDAVVAHEKETSLGLVGEGHHDPIQFFFRFGDLAAARYSAETDRRRNATPLVIDVTRFNFSVDVERLFADRECPGPPFVVRTPEVKIDKLERIFDSFSFGEKLYPVSPPWIDIFHRP